MNFLNLFKKREPVIKVTAYDVAHDLYCQMLRRPVQEHDEIIYTILRLHNPKKHIHRNPTKKHEDTSYRDTMDMASKYIDKYKGY